MKYADAAELKAQPDDLRVTAELVEGKDILEENGQFKWPLQPGDIIWGKSIEDNENPNK